MSLKYSFSRILAESIAFLGSKLRLCGKGGGLCLIERRFTSRFLFAGS